MVSILAKLPPPPLFIGGKQPLLNLQKVTVAAARERQVWFAISTKATGDSSESSTSLSVAKSVQNVWDKPEDRVALIGLGFAAIVAIWASANLITAIDKLPLIPTALELVGILFSTWFVYRYLLFKPDRGVEQPAQGFEGGESWFEVLHILDSSTTK